MALAMCVVWVWLCLGLRKSGWRYALGAIAIQFSIVAFVLGLIKGQSFGALFGALSPPMELIFTDYYSKFELFLSHVLPIAFAVGIVVFACLFLIPKFRLWSIAPSLLAVLIAAVFVGERVSKDAMCASAKEIGLDQFRRNTLLWSLANAPEEFQFEIHAAGEIGKRRMGWSYREMHWYEIPPDAWGDVDTKVFDCSPLTKAHD